MIGWWKSSKEWWPPARPPVHCIIIGISGFCLAIAITCWIADILPGLKATCFIPQAFKLPRISLATSRLGTPAAIHKPSSGIPSFLISWTNGYWKPHWKAFKNIIFMVIPSPEGTFDIIFLIRSRIIWVECWPPPANSIW